jgi:formylglycine-generating enzyme required for sulfatase activity
MPKSSTIQVTPIAQTTGGQVAVEEKESGRKMPAFILPILALTILLIIAFIWAISRIFGGTDTTQSTPIPPTDVIAIVDPISTPTNDAPTSPATVTTPTSTIPAVIDLATNTPTATTPPTITPTPTLDRRISNVDGMRQLFIPQGQYLRGANDTDPEAGDDEFPQVNVILAPFWIDETEVTNAQFTNCVADGNCLAPTTCQFGQATFQTGDPNEPVTCVSWQMAQDYCTWAGRTLPTEAQWERAAKGTDNRLYPWGNDFACQNGNFDDELIENDYTVPGGARCDGFDRLSPIGSFPAGASPVGALDMSGNVWEWVSDWYGADFYTVTDVVIFNQASASNPTGPATGDQKVARGGAWNFHVSTLRTTERFPLDHTATYFNVGFRCAENE